MSETLSYPNLIAGDFPRQTTKATIVAGANLTAGAILGKITLGALSAVGAAIAGNTGGSGAITAAPAVAAGTKAGVYKLICIEPGTNAGKFLFTDPDGIVIGVVTGAVENTAGGLTFTIADATDFASGDGFTITVTAAAGSGYYKLCDKASVDGSQNPCAVLAEDAAAASAVAYATIYLTGSFNSGAVSLATDTVVADVKAALQALNIYLLSADNNVTV
jgi:hypothetical protein